MVRFIEFNLKCLGFNGMVGWKICDSVTEDVNRDGDGDVDEL